MAAERLTFEAQESDEKLLVRKNQIYEYKCSRFDDYDDSTDDAAPR